MNIYTKQQIQETLKTKRLELVGFDKAYASDLYELWSDFDVIKFTYMPLVKSVEECVRRIEMFRQRTNEKITNIFVILLNGKAIGMIGAPVWDLNKGRFGLFYQLSRQYWGNGYTSEAAEALIRYLLEQFPNARIHADAVQENRASRNVLKKLGFRECGIDAGAFRDHGFVCNLVNYEYNK